MPFPQQTLPDFNAVSKKDAALLVSEIKAIIESNLLKLDELLSQPGPFTFDNLIQPIDEMNARLDNKAIIIQLLSEVMETDAVRDAYSQVDRFVTEYTTSFKQTRVCP